MTQTIKIDVNETLTGEAEVILYSPDRKFPVGIDFIINIASLWKSGLEEGKKYKVTDTVNLYVFEADSINEYCSYCSEQLSDEGKAYVLRQGAWSLEFDRSCFVKLLQQIDSLMNEHSSLFIAYNI